MARTVVTHITDDVDGSKDAEEVQFALHGVLYTIDLSKKNRAALERALKPYLDAATKVSNRSGRRGAGGRSSTGGGRDQQAIRRWAQSQGIEVSSRGRISNSVIKQYENRSQ